MVWFGLTTDEKSRVDVGFFCSSMKAESFRDRDGRERTKWRNKRRKNEKGEAEIVDVEELYRRLQPNPRARNRTRTDWQAVNPVRWQ